MTPRTFFTILLKILGVYLLFDSLTMTAQLIYTISFNFMDASGGGIVYGLFLLILIIGVYILIIRGLIFKPDWIIDKLSLDKNFPEEKIELNIHRSTVLSIAIIVIGALMFIDTLPIFFCNDVFTYVRLKATEGRYGRNSIANLTAGQFQNGWFIIRLIKIFIACFLMIYNRHVVNFIELRSKKILSIHHYLR